MGPHGCRELHMGLGDPIWVHMGFMSSICVQMGLGMAGCRRRREGNFIAQINV